MAKKLNIGKRALINKANSTVVLAAGVAAFILIFCLIASKTLLNQMNYQNRVIDKERTSLNKLTTDIKSANTLITSYTAFNSTSQNMIGGNPAGTGLQDGNNAKVVLDALPTTNDYLSLITSMYKLLTVNGATITNVGGSSDGTTDTSDGSTPQSTTSDSPVATVNPQPNAIPLSISATGDYTSMLNVINQLEHSVRPIQIKSLSLSGSQSNLTLSVETETYYQAAKSLNITKEVVK